MDGGYEVMIQDFFLCFVKVAPLPFSFGLVSGGELIGGWTKGTRIPISFARSFSSSIYYYYS